MAPGLRVAWLAIPDHEVRDKIALAKQGTDLQTGSFAQYVFHRTSPKPRPLRPMLRRLSQPTAAGVMLWWRP